MTRASAKASPCCFHTCLSCSMMAFFHYLSSSSLHRLVGLPLDRFPLYGFQVVIRDDHRLSRIPMTCLPRPSDLSSHICDLCRFSYQMFVFLSRDVTILYYIKINIQYTYQCMNDGHYLAHIRCYRNTCSRLEC